MSGTIDVNPEVLDQHASSVRTFMTQIEGATSDAGNLIDLKAFGIVCIEPAQILQVWISGADSFIKQAVAAGNEVADAVSEMATGYRQQETAATGQFHSLQMNLEGTG